MPELSVNQQIVLARRFTQFFSLPVGDRKSHPLWGEPKDMCEEGKLHFYEYCDNPKEKTQFLDHIGRIIGKEGGCLKCRISFLKYVFLIFP